MVWYKKFHLQLHLQTIDDTTKAKAAVEIRVAGLEQDLANYKSKYEAEVEAHTITKETIPKVSYAWNKISPTTKVNMKHEADDTNFEQMAMESLKKVFYN